MRDEGKAVAGYFPFPERLLPSLASLVVHERPGPKKRSTERWGDPFVTLDPCAGEGTALAALKEAWFPGCWTKLLACEMERTRGAILKAKMKELQGQAVVADAFRLAWPAKDRGCSVLYLNPPYDSDPDHARLEQRWLSRFYKALAPGGVLVFVVPARALKASAAFIAKHFLEVRCWRLPDPEFAAYHQVVLIGRRLSSPGSGDRAEEIASWQWGEGLPVLPEECEDPIVVRRPAQPFELSLAEVEFDLAQATAEARLWEGQPLGTDLGVGDLIGRQYPTALPPKPAHVALALTGGHFNGHRLRPNADAGPGWPPIMVKGVFLRELIEVERKLNKDGEETGSVQIEAPKLRMTGLRLDTFRFFEPFAGAEPSDAPSLDTANAADVLVNYSDSIAALMARQFPPLHDPLDPKREIRLPDLNRKLMMAQRHGVNAALKLIALHQNPKLVAEVGSGKSQISLTVAAALSPRHHAETLASLRTLGGKFAKARLPVVERTLVMCPPHLLDSWLGETGKVWPSASVVLVNELADLDRDGRIYVLGRETAKLGYGIRGIAPGVQLSGRCPRCGYSLKGAAEQNARRRSRCEHRMARPLNLWARLAEELAPLVLNAHPANERAQLLTKERAVLWRRGDRKAGKPDRAGFQRIAEAVLAEMARLLAEGGADVNALMVAQGALLPLARAAGAATPIGHGLSALIESAPPPPRTRHFFGAGQEQWTPYYYARNAMASLRSQPDGDLRQSAGAALAVLHEAGEWSDPEEGETCGEPLWQAIPSPRRFPIAKYICRRMPKRFQMLVLDEVHEAGNAGTAQEKAAHRLVELGLPTLALSGSVMGGYSSSLFANWWALDRNFRSSFGRDEQSLFVARYGFRKYLVAPKKLRNGEAPAYGAVTDREDMNVKTIGELPGVAPLFLLRHLLPTGVVIHKTDLDWELPPVTERPWPLEAETDLDRELLAEYRRLESALMEAIRSDMFTPFQGKLFGQLGELPSYLDRATADHGPFEIRYPEDVGGMLVAEGLAFPAEYVTPKERWLLDHLAKEQRAGRRTIVFCRHTGGEGALPARLSRLIRERLGCRVVILSAAKVPAQKREKWIDQHVIRPAAEVLIVNPNAVRTGLNNLVAFSSAVWYEADYDARTYRQANGRLHRIGQVLPVSIWFPHYAGTIQAVAQGLIARKVTASLQVDGLSVTGALEAAGAGEDQRASIDLAMKMGEAIYKKLAQKA